eukprot:3313350-Ditylum_brightwellii.AAC.1
MFHIQVIYHVQECGLNLASWAPNFLLPTAETAARYIDTNTWFANIDAGKMFHSYWLDTGVRPYTGVDLTILQEEGGNVPQHGRWARLMMGLTLAPFPSVKAFLWGKEII